MAFMFGGQHFADLRFAGARGARGLGLFRLICDVHFDFQIRKPGEIATVVQVSGQLSVQAREETAEYLGRVHQADSQATIDVRELPDRRDLSLGLDLSRDQVAALEDLRAGGGLTLSLQVSARVHATHGYENPIQDVTLFINQGTWVEILNSMGYSNLLLLEIPRGRREHANEMSPVMDRLREANVALQRGDWRAAVGSTRDVMESMSAALGDRDDLDQAFAPMYEKTRTWDRAARLRNLRRALRVFAHPAKHSSIDSVGIEWTREDALMALTIAGGIVGRMGAGKSSTI